MMRKDCTVYDYREAMREVRKIRDEFKFVSFEYDGDAQKVADAIRRQGKEAVLRRERTDTKGLKIYSVWQKG